jgi:dihydroorotase
MKTLLTGGTLVTEDGTLQADMLCVDGKIANFGPEATADDADLVFDATGMHVLPGFIDPHVHSRDPGQTHKEDFAHSTKGAALAGVSTVLEMPNSAPPLIEPEAVAARIEHLRTQAFTDFGLWALVFGHEDAAHLRKLRDAGVVAAKLFWGYSFDPASLTLVYSAAANTPDLIPPADNGAVWNLLRESADAGLPIGFHCEDRSVVQRATSRFGPATDLDSLTRTRPAAAESAAVATLVELARDSGARPHVVHVSSARTVEVLRAARRAGIAVSAETCPHYLAFTDQDLLSQTSALKVFPPVRGSADADALWEALADDTISIVGSDHAPHSCDEREGEFERQPAGIVGVQTSTRLLLDGVAQGRLSLQRLAEVMSTNTAKRFGLYPTKGAIAPGSDADLTVVDLRREWRIDRRSIVAKNPMSPYIGRVGVGEPVALFVRGRLVMSNGDVIGAPSGQPVSPSRDSVLES